MSARREPFIVFDLDDTLYLERDFALSGFTAVGEAFAAATGVSGLAARCVALFEAGERGRVIDRALETLAPGLAPAWREPLIDIYRGHAPRIALAPDAARWLARAPAPERLGLITDGAARTQRLKIQALELDRRIAHVVCTDDWGRRFWKPHPRAFSEMERRLGADPVDLVYVADNLSKDFAAPRRRGWRTIRIARPQRVHHVAAPDPTHLADAVIASLDALDSALVGVPRRAPEAAS
jgi:putative hydrolase of the HAD superfamily